jgi:hypothetical protein
VLAGCGIRLGCGSVSQPLRTLGTTAYPSLPPGKWLCRRQPQIDAMQMLIPEQQATGAPQCGSWVLPTLSEP